MFGKVIEEEGGPDKAEEDKKAKEGEEDQEDADEVDLEAREGEEDEEAT